jgi:5S rRNA maturation endonuclease (ribonuclease M5)
MTKGINESINDSASSKYSIFANFTVKGVVEVQDVVGALFGQTEGLLNDLELRELQKSGRIGRIVVNSKSENGITTGEIIIPSSLDRTETAILAATLETVDRVGPCSAVLRLVEIKDLRESKLRQIEQRAKELLKDWKAVSTNKETISDKITSDLEKDSIITWQGLPAGRDIETAERIIIVEGRNDIQQLLKIGVKNTIAVNGTSVPKAIIDLTHRKECIAFLDGDRGGEMILNELLQVSKIKYYARAPLNREVEELTPKELVKCLQQKRPIEELYKERKTREERGKQGGYQRRPSQKSNNGGRFSRDSSPSGPSNYRGRTPDSRHTDSRSRGGYSRDGRNFRDSGDSNRRNGRDRDSRRPSRGPSRDRTNYALQALPKDVYVPLIKELISSNEAMALDADNKMIHRTSNVSIFQDLDEKFTTVLMDGVVTQNFVNKAIKNKIKRIVAVNIKPYLRIADPGAIELFYFKDFLK